MLFSEGVLYKVRESLVYLKPSEKAVAQYILANANSVISMSVKKLAKESYSSPAAVMRFCYSLGYDGFKDFKIKLSGDLSIINLHDFKQESLSPEDPIESIMSVITENNIQSLYDTLQLINVKQLTAAYKCLVHAKKIDFYGVGSSYLVAYDAIQKFTRINKVCSAHSDFHMQRVTAANSQMQDAAVAISYSGETPQVIDCAKIAGTQGTQVIAITKYANSTLSQMADIVLFVAAQEDKFRSAAMSSRIAQLNILDIVYTMCAFEDYENVRSHLNRTHQVIQQSKKGGK